MKHTIKLHKIPGRSFVTLVAINDDTDFSPAQIGELIKRRASSLFHGGVAEEIAKHYETN